MHHYWKWFMLHWISLVTVKMITGLSLGFTSYHLRHRTAQKRCRRPRQPTESCKSVFLRAASSWHVWRNALRFVSYFQKWAWLDCRREIRFCCWWWYALAMFALSVFRLAEQTKGTQSSVEQRHFVASNRRHPLLGSKRRSNDDCMTLLRALS